MTTVTMRPYAGETDLQAIADLLNACEAVERLDKEISVSELRTEFDTPSLDKKRDLCLWEDADSKQIGFAQLSIPVSGEVIDGFLWFRVHPTARGGDIEKQIVAWGEERMREVASSRGVGVRLRYVDRADEADRSALVESCGFAIEYYFLRMARSHAFPIPEPQFPAGFTLRSVDRDSEAIAWVEMFNQTFIDHWNHHDLTVERFKHKLSDPNYRPDLDLIAIAPDGTFSAFCYCYINPAENVRNGRNEGWIVNLGTRRGFRNIGLGRAMLLTGMQRLKAAGVDTAKLDVDADNPTGATRLYESVGFRKIHTLISYVKEV